jgi:tetratricopeptide (TPR) repeat protein
MAENLEQSEIEQAYYLIENEQVFSKSQLWEMLRHYYESMGVEAWRRGEVPHYVTSNPRMANSYAEMVFAFYRDRQRLAPTDEPITICELGAGSGRLAFHFLSRLSRLCDDANVPMTAFRYVLTDLAPSNLAFLREHPRFGPYFDAGVLDVALFDVNQSKELALQRCDRTITPGSLRQPMIVIANYLFDSIPQDLFYINEQRCEECLITVYVGKDQPTPTVADLLAALEYRFDNRALAEPPYREAYLQRLLAEYQRTLSDSYLLFPAVSLRCLHSLRALSQQGMMLLSADKGDHRQSSLQGWPPPELVRHGSFSLNVNYHAFTAMCEHEGGIALFPTAQHRSVNVGCLLMVPDAANHYDTLSTYRRQVEEFSPDDFYSITKDAYEHCETMPLEAMLAYLRLSLHDGHQFARYVPRLIELAPLFGPAEHAAVVAAAERVWEMHFPLGEEIDLADVIGRVLYEMNDYARALSFFERSNAIYGEHTGTLHNIALCRQQLNQDDDAGREREPLQPWESRANPEGTIS